MATNFSQSGPPIHISLTTPNDQHFVRFYMQNETKKNLNVHTLYPQRLSVMGGFILYKDLMMYIGDDMLEKKIISNPNCYWNVEKKELKNANLL